MSFPVLSKKNKDWDFSLHPHYFHINEKMEKELMAYCADEKADDELKDCISRVPCDLYVSRSEELYPEMYPKKQNLPRPKTFRKHFLKAHGFNELPNKRQGAISVLGTFLFALGALKFFYWDFMICMGWEPFSIPIFTIVLIVLGFCMSAKYLIRKSGDISSDSYGFADVWGIIYFVFVASGIGEVASAQRANNMGGLASLTGEFMGSMGGIISIAGSSLFMIITLIWVCYTGFESFKVINAFLYKKWFNSKKKK
ncbi:MAG: hypothetical protein K2L55_10495 [Muribaculaceae bacterium]|nr:hypothetical protein [Muribaculaceae bacterium]